MDHTLAARDWFIRSALAYLGTPYIWGGDDPSGFDCSGFVNECLKSVGLLSEREDLTADGLAQRFAAGTIERPCVGALLLTLGSDGRAVHVVICLDEWYQIGASGGTHVTTSPIAAWRDNAYVKIRPIRLAPGRSRLIDPFLAL